MLLADLLGYTGGLLLAVSAFPQIALVYKLKNASQLSYVWLSIMVFGLAIWSIYGLLINSMPLFILDGIQVFLYFALIVMKAAYAKNKKE
ncbi:MAG: PQ-loop domain-containing transporter [Candidatus Micrarchaeia archaeon]